MKDIKKDIGSVIKTGRVCIGSKKVISNLLTGNPKLILISSNCPNDIRERIIYYSQLSNTHYHITKDNSMELGSVCGKPFPVSALGIIDEGESNILANLKKKPKGSNGKDKTKTR